MGGSVGLPVIVIVTVLEALRGVDGVPTCRVPPSMRMALATMLTLLLGLSRRVP